jgi:hypothetical protein
MPRSNRTFLTAWLGLIAMWLIVLAPLVSQLVMAARANEPDAALCSVTQAETMQHHGAGASLDACGYCDLLADHVPMPTLPAAALIATVLLAGIAVPTLSTRFTPLGAFPSGRPRGPPVFA